MAKINSPESGTPSLSNCEFALPLYMFDVKWPCNKPIIDTVIRTQWPRNLCKEFFPMWWLRCRWTFYLTVAQETTKLCNKIPKAVRILLTFQMRLAFFFNSLLNSNALYLTRSVYIPLTSSFSWFNAHIFTECNGILVL